MHERFGTVRKYKATYHPDPYSVYTFSAVKADFIESKETLDKLLRKVKLFNCINNDIDPKNSTYFETDDYKNVISYWHKLYLYYFPIKSQFELPRGVQNHFQYIDQYRMWQLQQRYFQIIIIIGLVISCFILIAFTYYQMYKNVGNQKQYRPLPMSSSAQV